MRKPTAIILTTVLLISQMPVQRAKANPAAAAVPLGAAIVIIGGIAYYVWLNSQGQEQTMPVSSGDYLEDPEEADQWGHYPDVKTERGCIWKAAGREYAWDETNKICKIKG